MACVPEVVCLSFPQAHEGPTGAIGFEPNTSCLPASTAEPFGTGGTALKETLLYECYRMFARLTIVLLRLKFRDYNRPEGIVTHHHLIEFTAEILGLVKSRLHIKVQWVSQVIFLLETTRRPNFSNWMIGLLLFIPASMEEWVQENTIENPPINH